MGKLTFTPEFKLEAVKLVRDRMAALDINVPILILASAVLALIQSGCAERVSCRESRQLLSSAATIAQMEAVVDEQSANGVFADPAQRARLRGGVLGLYSVKLDPRLVALGLDRDTDARLMTDAEGKVVAVFFARTRLDGIVVKVDDVEHVLPGALEFQDDRVALFCVDRD